MSKRDYYEVLGVGKSTSAQDIKKAYRRLVKQHHPDLGGSTEDFHKISEAYQFLME